MKDLLILSLRTQNTNEKEVGDEEDDDDDDEYNYDDNEDPRADFVTNLLMSCHEGVSVGQTTYGPLLQVLGGVAFMRSVEFSDEHGKTSSTKVSWHVKDYNNLLTDPFAKDSLHPQDETPVCGSLLWPIPFSAEAKYYLHEKNVLDEFLSSEVSFVRLITRLHVTANFGVLLRKGLRKKLGGIAQGHAWFAPFAVKEDMINKNPYAAPPFGEKSDGQRLAHAVQLQSLQGIH